MSKQRYLVNILTDGSCIAVKFENVVAYEESKADNPLEEVTRFEEFNQPVYRMADVTSKNVSDILKTMDQSIDLRRLAHWSTLHNLVPQR